MNYIGCVVLLLGAAPSAFPQAVNPPKSKQNTVTISEETVAELQRSFPSEQEISALLKKADEKVSAFEAAVKVVKPRLDKIDSKYAANYIDAAETARILISETLKNGPSAYRLVGILTTLDDLSLDSASGSVFLMAATQGQPTPEQLTLSAAGTACNDIAELIFHTTMRLIAAEEKALSKFLDEQH